MHLEVGKADDISREQRYCTYTLGNLERMRKVCSLGSFLR